MRGTIVLIMSLVLMTLAVPAAQAVENDEHHWVGHDRSSTFQAPAAPKGTIR
jgi:hypothetical protein